MSAELDIPRRIDAATAQADHLAELTIWATTAGDADALADAAARARTAKKLIDAAGAARTLAAAALRLEATCLRRLVQIGEAGRLQGEMHTVAHWIASLTDDELDQVVGSGTTLIGARRRYVKEREAERARWQRNYNDEHDVMPAAQTWNYYDSEEIAKAAAVLLDAFDDGQSFTVATFVDKLREQLGMHDGDSLVDEGLREAARQAMRVASYREEKCGRVAGMPSFLTFQDDAMGWLRIPWQRATVEHLRWFVTYRQQQAAEMAATAERLAGVLDVIERAHAKRPHLTNLRDLVACAPNPKQQSAA